MGLFGHRKKKNAIEEASPIFDPAQPWISTPLASAPIDSEATAVIDTLSGRAHFLNRVEAAILRQMQTMKPLRDHCQSLAANARISPDRFALALRRLARDRLILTREYAEELLNESTHPENASGGRITTAAWSTKSRVELLTRSIASFASNFREYGRSPRYLVCDDEPSPAVSRNTRAKIADAARQSGIEIEYFGIAEKRALIDAAIRRLNANEEIRRAMDFAVFGTGDIDYTFGGNHNAMLLAGAGECLLSLDDDTVCEPAAAGGFAPDQTPALLQCEELDDLYFAADRAEVINTVSRSPLDVIAGHERYLGSSPRAILSRAGGAFDRSELLPESLYQLSAKPCRIVVTVGGYYGDIATTGLDQALFMENPARDWNYGDEIKYRRCFRSREVVRIPKRPFMTRPSFFMMPQVGIDNRKPLPPFFPVYRGADGIFGATLRLLDDGNYIARLPFGILHDPPPGRSAPALDSNRRYVAFSELFPRIIHDWARRRAAPQRSMEDLGAYFVSLGTGSAACLEDRLLALAIGSLCIETDQLKRLLERYGGEPDYWRLDVELRLEAIHATMLEAERVFPIRLRPAQDKQRSLSTMARLLAAYGQTLRHWPRIVEASIESEKPNGLP